MALIWLKLKGSTISYGSDSLMCTCGFARILFNVLYKGATSQEYCCLRSIQAVLGYYPCTKRSIMKKVSNKFHTGALTITIFWGVFCRHSIKTLITLAQLFQVSIHVHLCYPLQQTERNSLSVKM